MTNQYPAGWPDTRELFGDYPEGALF